MTRRVWALAAACASAAAQDHTGWRDYAGGADSAQYSALKQITRSNVSRLTLAWHYPVPDRRGNFGFNPVVIDGVMYVLGQSNAIVALNQAGPGSMEGPDAYGVFVSLVLSPVLSVTSCMSCGQVQQSFGGRVHFLLGDPGA